MMHHHTKFGYKKFQSWGDIIQVNIQWHFEPFLWPWPSPQENNPIFLQENPAYDDVSSNHQAAKSDDIQMISSKPPIILLPNFVLWCIIMSQSVMQKDWFAIFIVKVLWPKYDNFYCIFWTADSFATKLGLIVHYHKPECLMEKLDCCVRSQGHSKISQCQWMFVQMIFSELLNLLLPNLADCLSKRLACCLQWQGNS